MPESYIKVFATVGAKDTTLKEWTFEPRPFQPDDVEIKVIACGVCVRPPPLHLPARGGPCQSAHNEATAANTRAPYTAH